MIDPKLIKRGKELERRQTLSIKDQLIEYQKKEIKELKEKLTDNVSQEEFDKCYPVPDPDTIDKVEELDEVTQKKDNRIKELEFHIEHIRQVILGTPYVVGDRRGTLLRACGDALEGGNPDATDKPS